MGLSMDFYISMSYCLWLCLHFVLFCFYFVFMFVFGLCGFSLDLVYLGLYLLVKPELGNDNFLEFFFFFKFLIMFLEFNVGLIENAN